jgi:hypothetical protein
MMELNLGVNFLIRLIDNFYIEAGVDLNSFMPLGSSGIIRPRLGVAWQL